MATRATPGIPPEVPCCGRPLPRRTAVVRSSRIRLALVCSLAALAACGRDARPAADTARVASRDSAAAPVDTTARDDFGDQLPPRGPAARIVSLNPTTTEILFTIGAGARLVGRTHWDDHPAAARAVPDLGDGIRPNVEAVLAARPDLVVLYASADNRAAARALRAAGVRVVGLKIDRVADLSRAARLLGRLTGDSVSGAIVADSVARTIDAVRAVTATLPHPTVFWPLLGEPLLAVGRGSFQHELIEIAGGRNAFGDQSAAAPRISQEEVLRRDPDVVMVGAKYGAGALAALYPQWRPLRAVRDGRVLVYDTALVLRPSVQLGAAAVSLARLLHPEAADRLPAPAAAPTPAR